MTRVTYTYAILDVTPRCYREVRRLLLEAGYDHTFHQGDAGEVIDMAGIALRADPLRANPEIRPATRDAAGAKAGGR